MAIDNEIKILVENNTKLNGAIADRMIEEIRFAHDLEKVILELCRKNNLITDLRGRHSGHHKTYYLMHTNGVAIGNYDTLPELLEAIITCIGLILIGLSPKSEQ